MADDAAKGENDRAANGDGAQPEGGGSRAEGDAIPFKHPSSTDAERTAGGGLRTPSKEFHEAGAGTTGVVASPLKRGAQLGRLGEPRTGTEY